MPNINAFRPVVKEKKIVKDLSKFSTFWHLNLNPHSLEMLPNKFN